MSERIKKLEAIFHAASELSTPEQQEKFLNEACLGDAELRREVDALLKAAPAGDELFQPSQQSRLHSGDVSTAQIAERPGTIIGLYKLLERIGEGGMGVVYMAEQERPVRRKVALKIIKLGMDTRQVIARFEAERQALAMMDHPHIAQVLDAGATDTGRPYFVMELVQGVPITQFCDTNQLSTADRLKLFIPVCHAIQSAHQKGIIHRDIKPSNVLVTMHNGAPHPMVIDFGVAKAIDQKLTEKTVFTNFGAMIGTPAYMSPEQAEMSKLDVDTRSDIYSLGVLLYELLTGTTPFPEERLRSIAYGEMQRIIAEEEPERPSTRLKKKPAAQSAIRNPQSAIDSDLDCIVMKCLEKDRSRRYETATGLAADIKHHLNNEPVLASPPSAAYRVQKWVRRNKIQFAAATIIALVLIAASVVSTWQALRATRSQTIANDEALKSRHAEQTAREEALKATKAEQNATEQAENAKAIKEFLLENLLGVDCCGDSVEPDAASFEATQALVGKVARGMEGRFTNQPEIEAEIRQALVRGFFSARDHRNIATQAERLLEIQRRLSGPYHTNTLRTIMDLAFAKYHLGQREEGIRLLTETISVLQASDPPERNPMLEAVEGTYGLLLLEEGRTDEALPYLRRAVAAARKNAPKSMAAKTWTAKLADALDSAGQWPESETLWRDNFESCVRDLGPMHPVTLDKQFGLGRVLVMQRRTDEALSVLPTVIAAFQFRFGSNYFSTLRAQCWQALALDQNGDTAAVTTLYTDLHPRLLKYVPYVGARYSFEEMASFFLRQRNYTHAKAAYEPLRTIFEATPPQNATQLETFIQATAATKGWPVAAEVYRKHFDKSFRNSDLWRSQSTVLLYGGDSAGYQEAVAKALAALPATTNLDEQRRIAELASFGPVPFSADQVKECETLLKSLEHGLAIATTNQSTWHRTIGALQLRRGKFNDSLVHLDKALASVRSNSERARVGALKALALHHLHRGSEARDALEQAETLMKPRLLDRLSEREGFLNHDERTYLIYRREARALLELK